MIGFIVVACHIGDMHNLDPPHYVSRSLPFLTSNFVGREEHVQDLTGYIDFEGSDIQVVTIVGPPGFGKSTLAIKVGHIFLQEGVAVHYVDLTDVLTLDMLAEKIMASASGLASSNASLSSLQVWLHEQSTPTLVIIDNCDNLIENLQREFFDFLRKIQLSSDPKIVKYLLTSQKRVVDIDKARLLEIYNLTTKAACQLLGKIVTNLTEQDKTDIAELTGNVPLALEIVGTILNYPNAPTVHSIIHDLKENPIPTLSQREIHSSVNISIGLAYKYLPKELKILGQYLSHFPGSFDSDSVHGMLEHAREPLNAQLKALVRCSLLQYRHSDERFSLICKYFRNSASSDITFLFKIKFIGYFVPKLERLVQDHKDPNLFRAPYEWTLAPITQYIKLLMVEKHNFLHILPVLKSLEHESWIDNEFVWNRLEYYNTSVAFIQRLSTTLHSNELLTFLEMQNIFNGMLEILDSFTEFEITNMDSFMKLYSEVAAKASSLLFDQTNFTAAVNVFFSRRDKFEHTYKQHNTSVETYIFFHTMLAIMYIKMEGNESSEGCFIYDHYKK